MGGLTMTIDLRILKSPEGELSVKNSENSRGKLPVVIDEVQKLLSSTQELDSQLNALRSQRNKIIDQLKIAFKEKKETASLLAHKKELEIQIGELGSEKIFTR